MITSYLFSLIGGAVSWMTKLQCVALSTIETEYMSTTHACKEGILLKKLVVKFGVKYKKVVARCDNQSMLHLAKISILGA